MKLQTTPSLKLNSKIKNQRVKRYRDIKSSQNISYGKKSNVSFTSGESFTMLLRFLETNQAWGATAVDIGCMDTPRTIVDFTRGPNAGIETMRREFSSTTNNSLIGAYGLGSALLMSTVINKKFKGIKAHKMFVSNEMLDVLSSTWSEHIKSPNTLSSSIEDILSNLKGFNPEHFEKNRIDRNGYVGLDGDTQKLIAQRLKQEILEGPSDMTKEARAYLKALFVTSTGAESHIKIERNINGNIKKATSTFDETINSTYKTLKAFMNDEVSKTFKTGDLLDNIFVKSLKKLNKNTSILGMSIAIGVALSLQPLNMYLTKLKTGKSGFVGVEGQEPNKTNGFKALKLAIAGIASYAVLRSIGKFSEILGKIQFKGISPTINQFKLIYGMTIASRLIAARDKNELRETSIKDSLGFAHWLILGAFISKLTAAGFEQMDKFKDDKFIRYNEVENGKGFFNWLTKSSLITRSEVLYSTLKKAGISTIKLDGSAMSFKEMLKEAPKEARTKIKYLALIQIAGYLYSGLVLGIGIPKLNIAITNAVRKRHKLKAEAEK